MCYWNPYVTGSPQITTLLAAMQWIEANLIATTGPARQTCDADFAGFGYRIPFSERWRDQAIWISYNPTPAVTEYGATLGGTLDIHHRAERLRPRSASSGRHDHPRIRAHQ
jgi:hypothetical protein